MKGAKGTKIEGPAIISLFAKNLDKAGGIGQTAAAVEYSKLTTQPDCEKAGAKWTPAATPNKCGPK